MIFEIISLILVFLFGVFIGLVFGVIILLIKLDRIVKDMVSRNIKWK